MSISKTRVALLSLLMAIITIIATPSAHAVGAYRVEVIQLEDSSFFLKVGVSVSSSGDSETIRATVSNLAQQRCQASSGTLTGVRVHFGCEDRPTAPMEYFNNACLVIAKNDRFSMSDDARNAFGVGIAANCQAASQAARDDCPSDDCLLSNVILTPGGDRFVTDGTATACPASATNTATDGTINCVTDPSTPSGLDLSIDEFTATTIDLSWELIGTGSGTVTYSLERSLMTSVDPITSAIVLMNPMPITLIPDNTATSFDDMGLDPGETYYYQVTATDSSGDSVISNVVLVETAAVVVPSGLDLSIDEFTATEVDLLWQLTEIGRKGITYSLVRSDDASFTTGTATVTLDPNTVTAVTDSGLQPGTRYYYQATATDRDGDSVKSNIIAVTTAVLAPSGLEFTSPFPSPISDTEIELIWSVGMNGGDPNIRYSLVRSDDASFTTGTATVTLDPNTVTAVTDSGLMPGTTYYYQLTATNDGGSSAPITGSATTLGDLTLTTRPISDTAIELVLELTETDGNEVIYSLQRSSSITLGGALVDPITDLGSVTDTTPDTNISFTDDRGLAPGTVYYYQVTAENRGGMVSTTGTATTAMAAVTPSGLTLTATATGTATINLSWGLTDTGGQTVTYRLESSRSITPDGALMTPIRMLVSGTATSFNDMGLAPGVTYYYQVTATGDSSMDSVLSDIAMATTDVAAPEGLTLTAEPRGATEAFLSWELDSNGGEAVTYSLARSLNPDLTGTTAVVLGSNMDIEVTDSGLTTGETYYYQVTATNSMGSELSNIEDVTIGAVQTPRILNKSLLPVIAQTTTAMTLCAISNRTNTVLSGCAENRDTFAPADTSKATFAGADTSHAIIKRLGQDLSSEQELGDMLLRWLGDSSFSHNFSGVGGVGDSGISVWGSGSYKDMEDNDSTLRWDGDLWGVSLGADLRINDWLLGTAVSWSSGEFDYTDAETTSTGDYDYENFSVHPYVNWAPSGQDYNLWGSVSYGQGDITIQDQAMPNEVSSDTSQYGIATGINLTLQTDHSEGFRRSVDLRSDFSALWIDVRGAGQAIASETIRTQRFRLLLSGEHDYVVGLHRHLIPGLEVGARYDIGGANNGAGVEVSSSLTYKDLLTGFHLAGQMNALLGAEYDEWGASALLRFGSSVSSRGLSFSLEPTIGRASADPARLWQQEASSLADNSSRHGSSSLSAALVSEVAYGMGMHSTFGVPATWQPYANMQLGSAIRRYRLGLRYQFVQGLGFRIEGQSLHSTGGVSDSATGGAINNNTGKDYGVQLKTEFEF